MPLPILSPIGLLLLAHMPRATVLACLVAMLSASPTCYCTSLSCRAHACLCSFLTSPSGLQSWAALSLINSSPPGRDLITPCGRTYLDSGSHTQFATTGTRQTPTTVPHLLVPLHCTIPGALHLPTPTLPLHAAPHPHATCLPWCLHCHFPRS